MEYRWPICGCDALLSWQAKKQEHLLLDQGASYKNSDAITLSSTARSYEPALRYGSPASWSRTLPSGRGESPSRRSYGRGRRSRRSRSDRHFRNRRQCRVRCLEWQAGAWFGTGCQTRRALARDRDYPGEVGHHRRSAAAISAALRSTIGRQSGVAEIAPILVTNPYG
jgi:hypothetical protein